MPPRAPRPSRPPPSRPRLALAAALLPLALAAPVARATPETVGAPTTAPPKIVAPPTTQPSPRRLVRATGAPAWFNLALEHRSRYERLVGDVRPGAPPDFDALVARTLAAVELDLPIHLRAELQDSRALAAPGAPLTTTVVNPFELLQATIGARRRGLLHPGDAFAIALGRMTLDLGSRRLVARNDFRNTINAFTGLDLAYTTPRGHLARAFAVLPVRRRPTDPAALARNAVEFDREDPGVILLGAFYASPLLRRLTLEAYALGLLERDRPGAPTADRRLLVPGLRLLRPAAPGRLDLQLELILQAGAVRATAEPDDRRDLRHLAFGGHAALGRTFAAPWTPRLAAFLDLATGDRDPHDRANNRFDPLFGARRFDLGPTGFFGVLPRQNLLAPGLRAELRPPLGFDALAAYRAVWLAAPRDRWATAALHDPTGASGAFVGHHLEARLRRALIPQNLTLELGGAALLRGEFARRAPGGADAPALYFYTQIVAAL